MPRDDHDGDDDTPIRRLTAKSSRSLFTKPAFFVPMAVASVVLFVVLVAVAVRAGRERQRVAKEATTSDPARDHDRRPDVDKKAPVRIEDVAPIPNPPVTRYSEGERLLKYTSWWTSGATPERIQALVDDMTRNATMMVVFNSEGEFTRVHDFPQTKRELYKVIQSRDEILDSVPFTNMFQQFWYFTQSNPSKVLNPKAIVDGERFELRVFMVGKKLGERLDKAGAALALEDVLSLPVIEGSGKSLSERFRAFAANGVAVR